MLKVSCQLNKKNGFTFNYMYIYPSMFRHNLWRFCETKQRSAT